MIQTENFRVALEALWANKVRSFLTALGIIIGVASVIAVVSVVQGLQVLISGQLQGLGANYVMVFPDLANQNPAIIAKPIKLTWDDAKAIQRQVPGIAMMTPVIAGPLQVRYRDRKHDPDFVLGVNENWQEVMNHTVDEGRFLSQVDLEHRRKVAVVGQEIVTELELGQEPIGKVIYVGSLPVTVVGIMEDRGENLGVDLNNLVFVPFDSALGLFGRDAGEQIQIRMKTKTAEIVEPVRDGIRGVLRQRHNLAKEEPDDFQVQTQDELVDTVSTILGSVTAIVAGVVGIALLVGGIGIMNILLVSVTERTREIGVRKALGARRQDVLIQFLIESIVLSLSGGVIGVAVGYGLGSLISAVLPGDFPPAYVPWWAIAIAFGFSTMVGVFFGSYPASRAARLDPIEALRYE